MREKSIEIVPPVAQTIIVLLAFIAFAAVFARLQLGTVLGFLIGGAAIGPSGLGVIRDLDSVHVLAELGVVFLLFNLGLELKLERLRLFGMRVYGLALAQLLVTAAVIAVMGGLVGLRAEAALIVGGALALSSTAVVLQVLRDLGRTLTQLGRAAIAILLVQDVAVGPLLVLVEALGQAGGALAPGILMAMAKAVAVVLVVAFTARFLIRPVLQFVAGVAADEVFTATALLIVLASSFATEQAGLSLELGAFVAGLMLADTEYRHQIAADIGPIRGLLLGFFFIHLVVATEHGLERRDHVADDIFRGVVQQRCNPEADVDPRHLLAHDGFHQQRVLRYRENMRAAGLSVPACYARQPIGDVGDLDIERGRVEQIEPPPRQHPLPGAVGDMVSFSRRHLALRRGLRSLPLQFSWQKQVTR